MHRRLPIGAFLLLALFAPHLRSAPGDPLDPARPIASLVPANSLLIVEGSGLTPILTQGTEHAFVKTALGSKLGATLIEKSELPVEGWLILADTFFGRPVLSTLAGVSANGVALAARQGDTDPELLLVLHGSDSEATASTIERVLELIADTHGIPGAFDQPARRLLGARIWAVGEEFVVAQRDRLLIVSNDRGFGREALELAADAGAQGLRANEAYRAASARRSGSETLWAWTDLDGWERALGEDVGKLRELARTPATQALLGPGISTLGSGSAVAASLSLHGQQLEIAMCATGIDAAVALRPRSEDHFAPPVPLPPLEDVAQGVLHRNYAALFEHRTELFSPEDLPGFSSFIAQLGIFFGGDDISEAILPHISPWLRILARPVEFDEGRTPGIPLPAAVLTADLADAKSIGPRIVSGFQTVIGVMNVDRAQNGGSAMQLRLGLEGDVEISSARFMTPMSPESQGAVDISHNLQPACAVVDDTLVIGTHEHLVRSVVRQIVARRNEAENGTLPGIGPPVEHLHLTSSALANAVEMNFKTLVMQKVLDEGVTYDQAEEDLRGLLLLLASIETLDARVRYGAPGEVSIALRLALQSTDVEVQR